MFMSIATMDVGYAGRHEREAPRRAESRECSISAATYIVALVVAVLVVRAAGLAHPLADLGLGTLVATVVVFAVSVAVDNSSIYDPYWSVQPLAIAGYYLLERRMGRRRAGMRRAADHRDRAWCSSTRCG